MQNFDHIAAQLSAVRPGHTLPQSLYISDEAFAFDTQVLLKSLWLYACTTAHVKKPGDWYVFELANNSVIIVRGRDGEIRAFHNTCKHRGARICNEASGNNARLSCPYHFWTYGLDGKLIIARGMPDGFDKADNGLSPVAVENIGGLLFICLADTPPPIDRARADISAEIGMYNLGQLKVAYQADLIDNANWKLVMENNRECYHCESNHPELLQSLDGKGFGKGLPEDNTSGEASQAESAIEAQRAGWRASGLNSEPVEFPDGWWHRVARIGLAEGANSQTLDGKPACDKLIWPHGDDHNTSLSVWTQPNSWHHFCCDHVVSFSVMPLTADKTLVRTSWLVHEDAVADVDYDLDHLTAVWRATNDQDRVLAEMNHAGICSDGYRPGQYSAEEKFVETFKEFYVDNAKSVLNVT